MKSIWSGTLGFGMVNIPVRMYSASEKRKLEFDYLDKDSLAPVGYKRVNKKTGKEIDFDDIVKGYEYKKGKYVVLTEEDFENASPKRASSIEILHFVDDDEIEPQYYRKPYYLEPAKNSERMYAMVLEALKETDKIAIAKVVIKSRERLVAVKAEDRVLVTIQLRYQDQLRDIEDLYLPDIKPKENELEIAKKYISMNTISFSPQKYKDTYSEELKEIIEQKAQGKEAKPIKKDRAPEATDQDEVTERLRKSLKKQSEERKYITS